MAGIGKIETCIVLAFLTIICTSGFSNALPEANMIDEVKLTRPESRQWSDQYNSQGDILKQFFNNHKITTKISPSITNHNAILHRKEGNPRQKKFAHVPGMLSKMIAAFRKVQEMVANNFTSSTTVAGSALQTTPVPGVYLSSKAPSRTRRRFPNRGVTRKPGGRPRMRPGGPGGLQGRRGMRRRRPGGLKGRQGMRRRRPGGLKGRPGMRRRRPGGLKGRPGMRRRPGGLRRRPGMRRRPGGLRGKQGLRRKRPGRPGMRRMRPRGRKGKRGMRRMRPGGLKGKPGLRRMRPGGLKGKPGMRRRPGGLRGKQKLRRKRPGRPGMRRMRPGGRKGKPGMRRMRPGGLKGKPGMRRMRPGGSKGKPGVRNMRPGVLKGKQGMHRRPGGLKGKQGMRRMRPGGLKGKPGMRRMRPANLKGKQGMRRRPGGLKGRPGMRRRRPGGLKGRPGMRRRPGGLRRRPGMRRRPGGLRGKQGLRRKRPGRPGMRRMRPGGIKGKPGLRRMRPGGLKGKPGMRRMRPGGLKGKPGMHRMKKPGTSLKRKQKNNKRKPKIKHKLRPNMITGSPDRAAKKPVKVHHRPKHTKKGKNAATVVKGRRLKVKPKLHIPLTMKKASKTAKTHTSASKSAACQKPPSVTNAHFKSMSRYHHGSKITYKCKDGYRLQGIATHICQLDGHWSGGVPTCIEDEKKGKINLKGRLKKLSEDITNVEKAPNGKKFIAAVVIVVIAFLFLICHCLRVSKIRRKLVKKHKEVIEEGLLPTRNVPGLCEVSNGLLKKCCCCGKSGLPSSFRPQKSRSRSSVGSSRHLKVNDESLEDDLPAPPDNFFTDNNDMNDNSLSSYWNYNASDKHRRRPSICRPRTNKQKVSLRASSVTTRGPRSIAALDKHTGELGRKHSSCRARTINQPVNHQAGAGTTRGLSSMAAKYTGELRKPSVRRRSICQNEEECSRFVSSRRKVSRYKTRMDEGGRCKRDKIHRTYQYESQGQGNRNSNGITWLTRDSLDDKHQVTNAEWLTNVYDKNINVVENRGQNTKHDHDISNYKLTDTEARNGVKGKPVVKNDNLSLRNFSDNFSQSDIEYGLTYGIYKTTVDLDSRHIPMNRRSKGLWYLPKYTNDDFHGEIVQNDCGNQTDLFDEDSIVDIDMSSKDPESSNYFERLRLDHHMTHSGQRDDETDKKVMFCTPKLSDVSPPYPTSVKSKNNNYNCSSKTIEEGFINESERMSPRDFLVSNDNGSIKESVSMKVYLEKRNSVPDERLKSEINQDVALGGVTESEGEKVTDTSEKMQDGMRNKCSPVTNVNPTQQMYNARDDNLQSREDENPVLIDVLKVPEVNELDTSNSRTLTIASIISSGSQEDDHVKTTEWK